MYNPYNYPLITRMDANYFFLDPGRPSGWLMSKVSARPFAPFADSSRSCYLLSVFIGVHVWLY
jgi:hypothetical protein